MKCPKCKGTGEVKSDPHIKEIIDYYFNSYLSHTGKAWYISNGAKIASLVRGMLSQFSHDELKSLIDAFFALPDDNFVGVAGRGFEIFNVSINKLNSTQKELSVGDMMEKNIKERI